MRSKDDFYNEILAMKTKIVKDTAYGANVIPVIELYKTLSTYEERKAFQDALERMLCDQNEKVRSYAVNVCLGFFVFRDSV